MKQWRWFWGLVVAGAVVALGAFWSFGNLPWTGTALDARKAFASLSPKEFQNLIATGDVTLINVHVPYEGKIPGPQLQIPFDRIEQEQGRLPADKGAKLAVYCMSGRMSEIAARKLIELGYRNVYNLEGGMLAWRAAGLPLDDWRR